MSLNQFLAYLEALGNWKRGNIQTNLCFLSIWCIQPACHKLFSRKICGIYRKDILPEFTRQNLDFYINVIQPSKVLIRLLKEIPSSWPCMYVILQVLLKPFLFSCLPFSGFETSFQCSRAPIIFTRPQTSLV